MPKASWSPSRACATATASLSSIIQLDAGNRGWLGWQERLGLPRRKSPVWRWKKEPSHERPIWVIGTKRQQDSKPHRQESNWRKVARGNRGLARCGWRTPDRKYREHSVRRVAGRDRRVACATKGDFQFHSKPERCSPNEWGAQPPWLLFGAPSHRTPA